MSTPTDGTQPRVPITILVRPASRDWLDELAHKHRLKRAEVARAALGVAKSREAEVEKILQTVRENQ